MPISTSEELFELTKSLSKAEKRNFKLYVNRLQGNESKLFIRLFDLLEKQKELDNQQLLADLEGITKTQFSNLKRHLYTQIITSLRLIHKQRRANIQVREYLDFAYILYGKGLHLQSLKLLGIAKRMAAKHHLNYLSLTIVEFEKFIESRHITRSKLNRDKELIKEATEINETITMAIKLSNLRLRLYGKYVRYGHIKNDQEKQELFNFFKSEIKNIPQENLGVMENVFLCQSYVWYNYILLDFKSCLKWAIKWVNLLKSEPEMQWRDIDLFMRGYHYILTAALQLGDHKTLSKYQTEFEFFRKSEYKKLNFNSQIIAFLYVHLGRLNNIILSGDFAKGVKIIPKTLKRIKTYKGKVDEHRILVLYYKIAWIFLGNNQPGKAIHYLIQIVNKDIKNLRQDIQGYARLLFLLCHYELENYDTLTYLGRSMKPYFKKHAKEDSFQLEIFNCIYELSHQALLDQKGTITKYLSKFNSMARDIYFRRSMTYLDITSWLEAKQKKVSLDKIIKAKTT